MGVARSLLGFPRAGGNAVQGGAGHPTSGDGNTQWESVVGQESPDSLLKHLEL